MAESSTDEMLLPRISAGDSAAFAELVHRHTSRFYAVAFRVLMNKEDAEDVVQDAFLKLWRGK
ncbi:MAG: RNA polymerase sigma factor, partial [Rickettsiales bacterium]